MENFFDEIKIIFWKIKLKLSINKKWTHLMNPLEYLFFSQVLMAITAAKHNS